MKVIYEFADGLVVIHPTEVLPIEEVARKDVPFGAPYLIVEDNAIPTDRTFRAAWEADFSNPDGYGLGAQRWFIAQATKVIEDENSSEYDKLQASNLISQMNLEILKLEANNDPS